MTYSIREWRPWGGKYKANNTNNNHNTTYLKRDAISAIIQYFVNTTIMKKNLSATDTTGLNSAAYAKRR
jgi:hypothetical protein